MIALNYFLFIIQWIAFCASSIFFLFLGIAAIATNDSDERIIALVFFFALIFIFSAVLYAPLFATRVGRDKNKFKLRFSIFGSLTGSTLGLMLFIGALKDGSIGPATILFIVTIGHSVNLKNLICLARNIS